MLKIKDSVDLKELEKFGFIYYTDKESCRYGCCEFGNHDINIFINNARVISLNSSSARSIFDFETLYDLIQANLVEKVEEER